MVEPLIEALVNGSSNYNCSMVKGNNRCHSEVVKPLLTRAEKTLEKTLLFAGRSQYLTILR